MTQAILNWSPGRRRIGTKFLRFQPNGAWTLKETVKLHLAPPEIVAGVDDGHFLVNLMTNESP
jgi:hypothetical protein